jgi:phage protein D
MPTIPEVGIPHVEVTTGNSPLDSGVRGDIVSVELNYEVDVPAMATITLNVWDPVARAVKDAYFDQFQLGTALEVAIGLNQTTPMFTGEVTALEPSFGGHEGGGDTLRIQAYDRLHRLRFGTKQRTFQKQKDSEIASQIADGVGLTGDVEDTGVKHPHVTQENVNDLTFLLSRAKQINYEVRVEDKTLLFRKTREAEGPAITLEYRKDLIRFSPRQRTVPEGGKVAVRGWDVKNKKVIVGTAGSGDESSKMGGSQTGAEVSSKAFVSSTRTITDQPVLDTDEAQKIAKAWFNRQQQDFIEADAESPGIPELSAGKTIEIKGVGKPFSGVYYVVSATHTIGPEGYRTKIRVRRIAV